MMMVVPIVVQRDAVELFEWIRLFLSRRLQSAVQWHSLRLRRADIYTLTLLHVTEIDRVDAAALVWDDGWFRMPQESPLCRLEESVVLDVGSSATGAEPLRLVLHEQFTDDMFAETDIGLA